MISRLFRTPGLPQTGKENAATMLLLAASQMTPDALAGSLDTSLEGLSAAAAQQRLQEQGSNEIAAEKPSPWYMQLLHCFLDPFNLLLLGLAVISGVTGDWQSVAVMLSMVAISVSIRFWQEYRSGMAAEKLKSLVQTTATVLRRNEDDIPASLEIPMQEVVAGDVVLLSAGDMMPADIRLIASRDLFVSQAMLTGESLPVEKSDQPGSDRQRALEQPNLCFMGTNVISGTARALVIATGNRTYFGSLAKSITGRQVQTSFDKGVKRISWVLLRFVFALAPLVMFINGFSKGNWVEAMMFAVSVAVGMTPQMLSMIVTANLAKGALRMGKHKVVVKRLSSIQNFGAMDVLCTDKTGTLTQDKIILHNHFNTQGDEDPDVLKYAYLNSAHQTGLKNLLDVAVLEEIHKSEQGRELFATLSAFRKIDELPFDFVRRRMSVIVEDGGGRHTLICKGAVEEMLAISTQASIDGKLVALDKPMRDQFRKLTRDHNEDGFRVLIVAYRELQSAQSTYTKDDECNLIVKGFLTFLDPPKESARYAIPALIHHGVDVKILTGDNAIVTRRICDEVGLTVEKVLLGRDIEQMSDVELQEAAHITQVFAKVSPLQKSRIIAALKARGHTVGFLGDGINDAPALREADVGMSVDTAVDIAKESADIILLEKSLMVLVDGIIEGRIIFANIIKYMKMALSSNFGNVLSVVGASLLLPFLPMLPLQLLLQNLLYDISQLAIPFDRVDGEMLKKPRQWSARDIVRFMLCVGPVSSLFDYLTFAVLWFYFAANTVETQSLFHTGWFMAGLLTQTLIVHMIRTRHVPFVQSRASWPLLITTACVIAVGLWLPFSPLAPSLKFVQPPAGFMVFLLLVVVGYWGLTSLLKRLYIARFGTWL
jgi:Mg2+-importing ATPase